MLKKLPLFLVFVSLFLLGSGRFSSGLLQNAPESTPAASQVRGLFFYSQDCEHCRVVYEEVIQPLQKQYGTQLDLRLVEISKPENYELLLKAEEAMKVASEQRGLPTLVIGDQILIGEAQVRARLPAIIQAAAANGGLDWPAIPGVNPLTIPSSETFLANQDKAEICKAGETTACDQPNPIYAAYFYQTGCQACSRVEADLNYLRSRYPQLVIEEFNIYDQAALGEWLARRVGRAEDFHSPALFIGDYAWIGEKEITPAAVATALDRYAASGAAKTWAAFDASQSSILQRFRSMTWLAVVFAGLVDGLNPCAFATLIFFISYLTLSGRRGREVLAVGGAFTLGVFLAYLAIGLGFYKVLELLGSWLTVLSRWVYGLTALLCFGLAVFAFLDYRKARQGKLEDMSLNLPHALRLRINATIRQGRRMQAYVAGAFFIGIAISFLELACTGQIYLPTIIFVSSIPELRLRAIAFLGLYNLLFILPLVIVFILAYYGTTSKDLTRFLERNAAAVKLGMVGLFLALGSWLVLSLL